MRPNVAAQMDPAYLEALYEQYQRDPGSLDESFQLFFQGFELATCPRSCEAASQAHDQSRVASLIYNYRISDDYGRKSTDTYFSVGPAVSVFAEQDLLTDKASKGVRGVLSVGVKAF